MSETMDKGAEDPLKTLENLVVNDPDLAHLENGLSRFNVFEAMGVVDQEIRHSDFLRFLLDPNEGHGLGDLFAKRFLQASLATASRSEREAPLMPVELDVMDLDGAEVMRERYRIDVLFVDERNELVVAIENKIWSSERQGQLSDYTRTVERDYPGWRKLFLYLSPFGEVPSHPEYLPVGHDVVRDVVGELVASHGQSMDPGLRYALEHYLQTLERHVLGDTEIAELCKRIYRKHRRALDLIYEHRPDLQDEIRELLKNLVEETPSLALDDVSKREIKFAVKDWDTPAMFSSRGWTTSRRIMVFEFQNKPEELHLKLVLGPGDKEVRWRLHKMAKSGGGVLKAQKQLGAYWNTLYRRTWLNKTDLIEKELEELEPKIRGEWQRFLDQDLPHTDAAVKSEDWFWADVPPKS